MRPLSDVMKTRRHLHGKGQSGKCPAAGLSSRGVAAGASTATLRSEELSSAPRLASRGWLVVETL